MMDGWNMTGWGWGWMSLWSVFVIVLIALLVAVALRGLTTSRFPTTSDSAMAVLRRRYAAGEIDEAEFQKRRAALEERRQEDVA